MPISKKLKTYLDANKIKHEILKHKKVFTAYDAAQTLREDLQKIVKSLLVKADKQYYIVSVPANMNLDFKKLAKALKVKKVDITKEKDMVKICKVKPGAMHAFGSLYKIPVLVDRGLMKVKEAIFASGDFMESVRMKAKDYADLESAALGSFGAVKATKTPASAKASAGRRKAIKRKTSCKLKAGIKK
ncbi:YbaK/EbsC family protein [Patescibacteria group bacterium]|nr:YbaK/EbsC family protein [Patescibacteria group bacterium]MBU4512632.1 YbaK/EbsC family protein [Patescibacteria group bacterium]MCG2693538.1 YbaK/EbsC family protein [Candidatus Parcubacteria bacterium]